MRNTQVVILAGGKGTRLRSVTGDLPKPLVDLCGEPLLGRQLEVIAASSYCRDVLILTGYGAQQIADYVGDGQRWGLTVTCVAEQEARGTAGAVLDARSLLKDHFIVMYGDTVLDVDLDRLIAAHEAASAVATLFLHPNDHPHDSDLVEVSEDGRVLAFRPYPHPPGVDLANLVNAGLYVLERAPLLSLSGLPERPDFGKHVFSNMLAAGYTINGYISPEYIKDAGTPERIEKVRKDYSSGRVSRMSMRHPVPAVFLDRDGVINVERSHITQPDDLELLPGVAAALSKLNRSEYRTIVVTNQPIVARGDCTIEQLSAIHARLDTLLGTSGAYVDRLYFCPHHPDSGFSNEVAALKRICDCRKPAPGMVEKAKADFNIDLTHSWMIGDTTTDIEMARRAGVRSILVRTGYAGRDRKIAVRPDFIFANLADATDFVLNQWKALVDVVRPLAAALAPGDVVLIGGLARSGKSSVASALSILLAEARLTSQVVSLDNWLRSGADRGPGVLGRYDMATAVRAIKVLAQGETVFAPEYDELSRVSIPDRLRIAPPSNGVLIIEGCTALLDNELVQLASQTVYVNCDESVRHLRFITEYRRRGYDEAEISALYESRNEDEVSSIFANRDEADTKINL